MRRATLGLTIPCLLSMLVALPVRGQTSAGDNLLRYADPMIGSADGGGATFVGATLPFSMVRLGPDTPLPQNTSGYVPDRPIDGFSHTHVSGAGGAGKYGNIMVVAQTGGTHFTDYASEKSDETARPGYYAVTLDRWDVRAELTAAERVGVHRYTADADSLHLLFDVTRVIDVVEFQPGRLVQGRVNFQGSQELEGYGIYRGGSGPAVPYTVYFSARFDRPYASRGVWSGDARYPGEHAGVGDSTGFGAYASFPAASDDDVELHVGISFRSIEQARQNRELYDDDGFDDVHERARGIWAEHLGRVRVDGGTETQRTLFYSTLYNTMLMPTDVTGENPHWVSDEPIYWDYHAIWDTYRTVNPLLTLILPERQRDLVRSIVDIYRHTGWMPEFFSAGYHAYVQGGTNASIVVADALAKGLDGIDYETAYEGIKKNADVPSDQPYQYGRDSDEYIELGFSSTNKWVGASRTLEYAFNDFAVSQVAKVLGYEEDYRRFLERSFNSYNLFRKEEKFFWPKHPDGSWLEGFDPEFRTERWWEGPYFYEGMPWHYSAFVPHDIGGLVRRHGGREAFAAHLDRMFDEGHYIQHNQPDIMTPYLYAYTGRPDRTAERVRHILATEYRIAGDGLPGQDDAGTMSGWYVFSALGLYPNSGTDVYFIGSPLFSRSNLHLGDGQTFTIVAEGVSDENRYVQSATLNGQPWDRPWFRHDAIAEGGELVLTMGPEPSDWGHDAPSPPSASDARDAK